MSVSVLAAAVNVVAAVARTDGFHAGYEDVEERLEGDEGCGDYAGCELDARGGVVD